MYVVVTLGVATVVGYGDDAGQRFDPNVFTLGPDEMLQAGEQRRKAGASTDRYNL